MMAHVYRVGSLDGARYFGTAREAGRCRPGGEWPESVRRLDAAAECDRLAAEGVEADRRAVAARRLLADLWDACAGEVGDATEIGRRVMAYFERDPLPPAGPTDEGRADGGSEDWPPDAAAGDAARVVWLAIYGAEPEGE